MVTREAGCHYYLGYGLRIRSVIPLPGLGAVPAPVDECLAPDLEIDLEPIREDLPQQGDWHRLSPRDSVIVFAGAGAIRVRNGSRMSIQPVAGAERELARFVVGPAMGLLLQQRGLYCLHASCVRIGDDAVAIAGDSGAGKSTLAHALLQRGHGIVADDIAAIDASSGTPMVHPGRAALRLTTPNLWRIGADPDSCEWFHEGSDKRLLAIPSTAYEIAPLPLRRVYVLIPGHSQAVEEIGGLPGALALLRHCYFPTLASAVTDSSALMQRCVEFARHVRVFRLHRRQNIADLAALTALIE